MIDNGIAHAIWRKGFVSEGIKNSFQSYLCDKVKNMQKKRLQQKSMDDFAGEFSINTNEQSDVEDIRYVTFYHYNDYMS